MQNFDTLAAQIAWDANGLVPVIAQNDDTLEVLMMAWMNRESLRLTLETRQVHYWSRSRQSLWRKGETSGHVQELLECTLDCDGDTLLIKIRQTGPACHTGKKSCFFNKVVLS